MQIECPYPAVIEEASFLQRASTEEAAIGNRVWQKGFDSDDHGIEHDNPTAGGNRQTCLIDEAIPDDPAEPAHVRGADRLETDLLNYTLIDYRMSRACIDEQRGAFAVGDQTDVFQGVGDGGMVRDRNLDDRTDGNQGMGCLGESLLHEENMPKYMPAVIGIGPGSSMTCAITKPVSMP